MGFCFQFTPHLTQWITGYGRSVKHTNHQCFMVTHSYLSTEVKTTWSILVHVEPTRYDFTEESDLRQKEPTIFESVVRLNLELVKIIFTYNNY